MGCTMPLSRMEAASACSAAASMPSRGWKGFASSLSTGTSAACSTADGSGSGRRAESPLPSAFLFMRHHFLGQVQVGLGPLGPYVIEQYGFAEAGGLGQPHAARDDGAVHLVLEVLPDLDAHLLGQVGAVVGHGQQDALDLQGRV